MIDKKTRKIIASNLKKFMKQDDLTEAKLAEITGLNAYQIGNIVHCRACPEESLEKVAAALKISTSKLTRSKRIDFGDDDFNIPLYNELSVYVSDFVKEKSLVISKDQMDSVIYTIYKHQKNFPDKKYAVQAIMTHLHETCELREKLK